MYGRMLPGSSLTQKILTFDLFKTFYFYRLKNVRLRTD